MSTMYMLEEEEDEGVGGGMVKSPVQVSHCLTSSLPMAASLPCWLLTISQVIPTMG